MTTVSSNSHPAVGTTPFERAVGIALVAGIVVVMAMALMEGPSQGGISSAPAGDASNPPAGFPLYAYGS
jgi:hypothetical protein